ncbi:hypothetical protein EBZ80_22440 [bacterium]|nr:hypothetical protein [bacterium]
MTTNSDYSIINVQDVVLLVQSINTFSLQTFSAVRNVKFSVTYKPPAPAPPVSLSASGDYILTVLDYNFAGTTDYVVLGSLIQGTESPSQAKGLLPLIFFGTIAAAAPVVLVSAVQLLNAQRIYNIIKGTNVYLYYKSEPYLHEFYVQNTDRLREHKAAILNLFSGRMRTYILFNSLVVHFLERDGAYQPVCYGLLDQIGRRIETKMTFDWADGTLVGRIGRQPIFYDSKNRFRMTNYYPIMEQTSNTCFLIQGGVENYICDTEKDALTGVLNKLDRITVANKNDYQRPPLAPPYQMETRYAPVSQPIKFAGSADGLNTDTPFYLIGFNNVNTFYADFCTSVSPATYAVFQNMEYDNIQNTIVQTPYALTITTDKTRTPYKKTITVGCLTITFNFLLDTNNQTFTVAFDNSMTFRTFVEQIEGNVSIDQLTKCPFYMDLRVLPGNYYGRQNEVEPNTLRPGSGLESPQDLSQDGRPWMVSNRHTDASMALCPSYAASSSPSCRSSYGAAWAASIGSKCGPVEAAIGAKAKAGATRSGARTDARWQASGWDVYRRGNESAHGARLNNLKASGHSMQMRSERAADA